MRKWVQYWANKYRWAAEQRNDIDYEDLCQAAYVGAYIAKQKYTPDKGKFSTFSSFYIRNEIRSLLGIRNGNLPPFMISLDEPVNKEDGDETRLDLLEDETTPDKVEDMYQLEKQKGVRAAIKRLPDQQQQAMTLFYLQGKGLKEISSTIGISVRQVVYVMERARLSMRRDRLLRELMETEAPYYIHIGVKRFQSTGISAVEQAYFILEKEKAKLQRMITQDTQEEYCKYEEKIV